MKNEKILLNVSDLEDLKSYKKLGISNFLFPLKGFSIGYTDFSFEEIAKTDVPAYVLVNRLLTDDDIDSFLNLTIPSNVKGFIVEDTGLFYELKDKGFELINFQNHLNNNFKTINYWLKMFDSLVISTDITKEEIEEIVQKSCKPLVIPVFLFPMIMYSRRTLVTNYYKHLKEEPKYQLKVDIINADGSFNLVENAYGTAVFDTKHIDIREFASTLAEDKIRFYLIDSNFLDASTIIEALRGKALLESTKGFLEKKTVYKVGDLK